MRLENNYISSMSFNADNSLLTAGTAGGEIFSYNIIASCKTKFKFHSFSEVNTLRYSPYYETYIGASFKDGSVKVIDTETNETVNNFTGYHSGSASSLCFSPINKLFLCSVGLDGRINFYDIKDKK